MAYPGKSPRADKVSVGVKTEAPDFLEFGRSMAIGRERGDLRAGDSEPSVVTGLSAGYVLGDW